MPSPYGQRLFTQIARDDIDIETEVACTAARLSASPSFSRSYFVPLSGGAGVEVMDRAGYEVLQRLAAAGLIQFTTGAVRELYPEAQPAEAAPPGNQ